MSNNPNQIQIDFDEPEDMHISGQLDLDLSLDLDSHIPKGTSISTNLEDRARNLIKAIENYSSSNSNRGFIRGAQDSHPELASSSDESLDIKSHAANRQERVANDALRSAIGVVAMRKAGYAPSDVDEYEKLVFRGDNTSEEKTESFRQKYYYDPDKDSETNPVVIKRKQSAKARLRAKYKEELRSFISSDKEIPF